MNGSGNVRYGRASACGDWRGPLAAMALASVMATTGCTLRGSEPPATEAGDTAAPAASAGADELSMPRAGDDALLFVPTAPQGKGAATATAVGGTPIALSERAARAAAQSGTLMVALPDGRRFAVRHERSEHAPDGNWTFHGRVDTSAGALAAVVTFGPDAVFGLLPAPDGNMMKITTRGGQAYLRPAGGIVPPGVDPAARGDDVVRPPPIPGAPPLPGSSGTAAAMATAQRPVALGQVADDAEATIDLLAAYTSNLVALRGSAAAAQTEFRNLVAIANQAHEDSGSVARFAIAAFAEIDYPAQEGSYELLLASYLNDLPDGTDLHAQRDAASADLVAVIRPYPEGDTVCGIAYLPGYELQAYALYPQFGFSVTAVEDCAPLVLAHELGHNLGLMHDRDTVAGGGALQYGVFPYAFGYRQDGPPAFATVMAYDVGDQVWINRFSHPGSGKCSGVDCGIAGMSDNVRAANQTAGTIARFRDPPGTISVLDGWVLEPSGTQRSGALQVRLSSPAPAGGIVFDLDIVGGTATLGADVLGFEGTGQFALKDQVIPAGATTHDVYLTVVGDLDIEPDEIVVVALRNVRGAVTVHGGNATLTIADDDRTVLVTGRVWFPGGSEPPQSIVVHTAQWVRGLYTSRHVLAVAPDYSYDIDVPEGAALELESQVWGALLSAPVFVEAVDAPLGLDIMLRQGVRLSGTISLPDGVPVPPLELWNQYGDGATYIINPGDWDLYRRSYDVTTVPGVPMRLEISDPPAGYAPQVVQLPPREQDGEWNIVLRDVPSLTIPHAKVMERAAGQPLQVLQLEARLTRPAPPEGILFTVSFGGDAGPDDFMARAGIYRIPGGMVSVPVSMAILGDDRREPDEVVEIHVSDVSAGAWNPGPGSVTIVSDDPVRGDSGRCTYAQSVGALVCE